MTLASVLSLLWGTLCYLIVIFAVVGAIIWEAPDPNAKATCDGQLMHPTDVCLYDTPNAGRVRATYDERLDDARLGVPLSRIGWVLIALAAAAVWLVPVVALERRRQGR